VDKGPDAFRTISEVGEELDIPQHVLRFWETRFPQIKPLKRGGGRRYYRPDDVELLRGIRHLLYGKGYTIKGVQRILKEEGVRFVQSVWREGAVLPARHAEDDEPPPQPAMMRQSHDLPDEAVAPFASSQPASPPSYPAHRPVAPSPGLADAPRLSAEDRRQLEMALAELGECRRILDLVRQNAGES
jgi:DNA-binding transcriptional MerR regulator